MKCFLIGLSVMLYGSLSAQPGDIKSREDSMMRVMEKQMTQHRIYLRMYEEDPKSAVDSLITADKLANEAAGRQRLEMLLLNDRIDTLKEINLAYAGLTELPAVLRQATFLEVLLLDYNDIGKLPRWLDDLPNLKRLYWRGNSLEDVWWIRIPEINALEKLDISNNTLTRVPSGIKKLYGLKELILDENLLEDFPVGRLKRAEALETLSLNKIPGFEISRQKYGRLNFLKVLKINNSRVEQIDPSFCQLAGLTELQLQENRIATIPPGISSLSNLTKLSFYKNELTTLPEELFDLKKLEIIDLYHNQLEVVPGALGNLVNLEILFLSNNRIYSVPESIGNLKKLQNLYLHHNRLSTLPESIARLDLVVARVNDNYLIEFPTQFLGMRHLEDLDVSNNQITFIPKQVEELSDLRLFTYQQNPVDFDKPENGHLAPMIVRMMESGTICVPRVQQEEVRGTAQ